MFSSYKRLDCYSLLQDPLPGVEVHVVRAANSDRWSKRELQQLHEMEEPSEQPKVILLQRVCTACPASRSKQAHVTAAVRGPWKVVEVACSGMRLAFL